MSVSLVKRVPVTVPCTVACTRLIVGDDIRVIRAISNADWYLVYDNTIADAAVIPATARIRIPANMDHPILYYGVRPLIASVTGTADVSLHPLAEGD